MWVPCPSLRRPFYDTRPLPGPDFFTPLVRGAKKPDYWWSKADRAVLLSLLDRFRPRSVLEFGPGLSTLAFVERGVGQIDTFDDSAQWFDRAREALARWPQVRVRLYNRSRVPLFLPQAESRYDLGFVDGPYDQRLREPELRYALGRCRIVVAHDSHCPPVSDMLRALPWNVEDHMTDPPDRNGTTGYGMGVVVVGT